MANVSELILERPEAFNTSLRSERFASVHGLVQGAQTADVLTFGKTQDQAQVHLAGYDPDTVDYYLSLGYDPDAAYEEALRQGIAGDQTPEELADHFYRTAQQMEALDDYLNGDNNDYY
jgi:hypothetical protein